MVLPLLQDFFDQPIQNLQAIQGGNVAQAFSFSVGSRGGVGARDAQEYIIRFNPPMLVNFEKEAFAYAKFASPTIPIPRVIHLGRLAGYFFAITEKMPGQNLLQIPRSDYIAIIPKLIEVLDAIHQIPLTGIQGYGIFDGEGLAPASSWKEHLESVHAEEPEGDFFSGWHALFKNSFLEQEFFESLYQKMVELSKYCTEERYLVHGGFGFGNVLVQDGNITAILDWMDARSGDFLYDIAWLDFWSLDDHWRERFRQHYRQTERVIPFYNQRILCCQCYIALNAMKFYAKAGSKESYDFAIDRILSLLRGE